MDPFFQNGRILVDIFWVNSSGHFLVVITNGANAGGAGAKPLVGSANTVQCQVMGCRGEASGRFRKDCSFPGQGVLFSVMVRLD